MGQSAHKPYHTVDVHIDLCHRFASQQRRLLLVFQSNYVENYDYIPLGELGYHHAIYRIGSTTKKRRLTD